MISTLIITPIYQVLVSPEAFEALTTEFPQVLRVFSQILAQRLQTVSKRHPVIPSLNGLSRLQGRIGHNHNRTGQPNSFSQHPADDCINIAVVKITPSVDDKRFCEYLQNSLSLHGKCNVVERENVDEIFGCKMCDNLHDYSVRASLTDWLSAQVIRITLIITLIIGLSGLPEGYSEGCTEGYSQGYLDVIYTCDNLHNYVPNANTYRFNSQHGY